MRRQPQHHQQREQRGFTLVELMISLVLFSFAVAGVLAVAVSVTRGYREQRQAVMTEASVRAPLDFLADAIRQASPGVNVSANVQDFATCEKGGIVVTNVANGPDELDLFYASGGVLTTLMSVFDDANSTGLTVADTTGLVDGDYVLVTDFTNGMFVQVTAVTSATTLALDPNKCGALTWPTAGFPAGAIVVRAQHAHFRIGTLDGIPTLMMDPDGLFNVAPEQPLAEGVEDMQLAVGIDTDGTNGLLEDGSTTDEWIYNNAGDAVPLPTDVIRAVRITLISRTSTEMLGNASSFYFRPAAEDHAAGALDSYRRRILSTTVELRNIDGSP